MPKNLSEEKSQIIINALNRGMSRGHISGVCGVSKRAITRINSNLKKHGQPRAPPSGAKLGRPVKVNKTQADAMIVWMAKENHTFFVKDLVAFLRDEYRYKGCDGTIRRCLMRAGYRRKLPWQRSEKTVWIPPNYKPTFVTSSSRHKKPTAAQDESPMPADAPELQESDAEEEEEHHAPDIDPALQQSQTRPSQTGPPGGSQQSMPPPNPYQLSGQQPPHIQRYYERCPSGQQKQYQQQQAHPNAATYTQTDLRRSRHQPATAPPLTVPQTSRASRPSSSTPAAQSRRPPPRSPQPQATGASINKSDAALAALQQQLAERDSVIASLQQQLTAQQQHHRHQPIDHGHQNQIHGTPDTSHPEQHQSQPQYHDMRHNPGVFDAYHISPDLPPTRPRQRQTQVDSQPQPLQHSNYTAAGGHWPAG